MKHLQFFERYRGSIYTYDVGEYVKTYMTHGMGSGYDDFYKYFKVIKTRVYTNMNGEMEGEFLCQNWDGGSEWFDNNWIECLMTKSEIKRFKLKEDTKKYNL